MTAEYQEVIETDLSKDLLLSKITSHLVTLGVNYNLQEDKVVFSTRTSFFSWGEKVSIHIQENLIKIKSICKLKTQIFDWGKNKRNVKKIIELI